MQQQHQDTNISHYSIKDLLTIFNLNMVDNPTVFQINDVANNLIARMRSEGKMDMAIFFENAKQKVIQNIGMDMDTDTSDTDTYANDTSENEDENNGMEWWQQENPILTQQSRAPPPQPQTNLQSQSQSQSHHKTKSYQMIEYEKNIIIEKLQLTEFKLREMEKENKKLKKQIRLLQQKQ
jgi:hypothetical protein